MVTGPLQMYQPLQLILIFSLLSDNDKDFGINFNWIGTYSKLSVTPLSKSGILTAFPGGSNALVRKSCKSFSRSIII